MSSYRTGWPHSESAQDFSQPIGLAAPSSQTPLSRTPWSGTNQNRVSISRNSNGDTWRPSREKGEEGTTRREKKKPSPHRMRVRPCRGSTFTRLADHCHRPPLKTRHRQKIRTGAGEPRGIQTGESRFIPVRRHKRSRRPSIAVHSSFLLNSFFNAFPRSCKSYQRCCESRYTFSNEKFNAMNKN